MQRSERASAFCSVAAVFPIVRWQRLNTFPSHVIACVGRSEDLGEMRRLHDRRVEVMVLVTRLHRVCDGARIRMSS